ncbi:hypothetical protein B0H14DRAFT_2342697, partial [Mycena olivaceomarginata]
FRALVSTFDFNRLKNCFYIEDKEALDAFTAFVYGLGAKKITDWWRHKEMHEWIIPCMVKSQSQIPPDVWDSTPSTTNTSNARHHWANALAGINPSNQILFALFIYRSPRYSRRKTDRDVAEEIKMSMSTGILLNPNNQLSHRVSRNSQRQSAAARKAHESRNATDSSHQIRLQIEAEAEKRRASNALTKTLKAQLKASKGSSGGRDTSIIVSSSSSGRVTTARTRTGISNCICNIAVFTDGTKSPH